MGKIKQLCLIIIITLQLGTIKKCLRINQGKVIMNNIFSLELFKHFFNIKLILIITIY